MKHIACEQKFSKSSANAMEFFKLMDERSRVWLAQIPKTAKLFWHDLKIFILTRKEQSFAKKCKQQKKR